MIHTKLLIRRLAYVPWLLAAGLVLGWAGEAAAITLSVSKSEVREDAGETKITIKAKAAAKVTADTYVALEIGNDGAQGLAQLNNRYRMTLSSIKIPKDKDEGTVEVTFIPTNDKKRGSDNVNGQPGTLAADFAANADGSFSNAPDASAQGEDIWIPIVGEAGGTDVKSTYIWLRDDDKLSTTLTLSPDPASLSKDAGSSNVKVTATLNGSMSSKAEKFPLVFDPDFDRNNDDSFTAADSILTRDADYGATTADLTLRKRKSSGEATISIDPKGTVGYIAVAGKTGHTNATANEDTLFLDGIDLNLDGDTGDSFTTIANGNLSELALGKFDFNGNGNDSETDELNEGSLGIDINADGDLNDAIATATGVVIKESALKFGVLIKTETIKITPAPVVKVKDKGLTVSHGGSIREDDGAKELTLTVTLDKKAVKRERVVFEIVEVEDAGERDRDYVVEVDDLYIDEGETSGTATLRVDPDNNTTATGNRQFKVKASLPNGSPVEVTVTIVDVDSFSTKITLSADPKEIKEDADADSVGVPVTITATLNGQVFDEDKTLTLALRISGDGKGTATRDVDYTARIYSVKIDSGMVSGSREVVIFPIDDGIEDKDETIKVMSTTEVKNGDDEVLLYDDATITLKDTGKRADPKDQPDGMPSFSKEAIAGSDSVIEGVVGSDIKDTANGLEELAEATGGDGALRYRVSSDLPDGLTFDPDTRTIEGTPTAAGTTTITYMVVDSDMGDDHPDAATLSYTIEIGPKPAPTVKVASVTLSQTSVREGSGETRISVTAKLAEAAPIAETIEFTLGAPSTGSMAVRDVDYQATLGGKFDVKVGDEEAITALLLTPSNNEAKDGDRLIGLHASASGGSASADITIADDETESTSILLSATPNTVGEDAGVTHFTITASLDGKVEDADTKVAISIDAASSATRDEDYVALFVENDRIVEPIITIPAGEVSGSVGLRLSIVKDGKDEGTETISLTGSTDGLASGAANINLTDYKETEETTPPLAFAEGTEIDAISATAGTPISSVELPAAEGGSGDISYSTSDLPAGLSFDSATRMLSGTPEAATEGAVEVTYTATAGDESDSLAFSITVNPMLDFGDVSSVLLGASVEGAGKANPADEHDSGGLTLTVGVPVDLTLPEIPGGTPPKTYDVAGLPAGLSFDAATRTISGTPTEEGLAAVVLTVTDAAGASGQLPFAVSVILPPLDAPANLVAEDYKGADGLGDQGGFVMLSWELTGQHDSIDGYRIFRALPVLGNEMIPWAMVDAVPGVARGVAIVATLDNVSTRWGIAAESGGRTTHGAAKAVFVSADNPYELMAETMMASQEAAQVGNGPVFASLLPEALAYARGVAPKMNIIGSVISSAVTMTEEAVGATDDIAPLAVPSLNVLDAPNDQGGRIALTWTLSPSDQLLQGVIAGAIGPTALEPVVGVHGYSIYRSAMGEDEFALIAQVDAGVASFVDETALNGVHYTYQVRPYDLDNETGSDIAQTAMAVRNSVKDSEGRALYGLFGADNRIGFDDFFIFADNFGLTAGDAGFDPAFDLAPSEAIDFDDFFVFADNFGRSIAAAGKRVPMLAGLNADARMYLDARTAMPNVGQDFVLDVRLADFAAIKGYGLQVQYEASKLEFVEVRTDQPLGGSELATPQVLADQAGVLTVATHGDVVSDGEVALSLVFRPTTEIENTVIEITDNQTYDSAFGFNRLALPAPVQVQTRPEVFSLANNYPNPFNPATTIKYALPQAADVALTVYNVLGQPVRTLVAEHQNAGRYVVEWDATNDSGHSLSSGMYFYRLEAGGDLEVKKMLLLK